MKLDGSGVQFFLSQMFDRVSSEGISRTALFDYPILYDVTADMSGHVVLIPAHERPTANEKTKNALFVCMGEPALQALREAGLPVITVRDEVTFQHLYNKMQSVFVRNDRMEAQMHAYVTTHAGFQPLIETCSQATGFPCTLIDEQYHVVCRSTPRNGEGETGMSLGGEDLDEMLESEIVDLFMASRDYRNMRSARNVFAVPGSGNLLMKNVFQGDKLVGSLAVQHEGSILSARFARFLLNYLCSFVEDMYARIGSFKSAEVGRDLVRAAIRTIEVGEEAGYAQLEAALEESGHGSGNHYVVARIERSFTNEGSEERGYLSRRLELALPRACCFFIRNHLFVLVAVAHDHSATGRASLDDLPIIARDNLSKMALSRPFTSVRELDAAIIQAEAALESGSSIDSMNWVYRFDDYAFPWLVKRACADVPALHVCHAAIPTLMRFDELHGSSLLNTLFEFVRCRYNATAASEALFVARSTLLNRLERIVELTGVDLDDYSERAYLGLSFAMIDVSDKVYSRP